MYLIPTYEEEDLKVNKLAKNTYTLQILQNQMIRAILGINKKQHINMKQIRIENNMMSVNQMSVYHTLVEAHNIMRNSSSEQIKLKWTDEFENKYSLRSKSNKILKVPEKPMTKCRQTQKFLYPKHFRPQIDS